MKLIITAVALISVAASFGGCASYSPDNPLFKATRGKEIYGQVNTFFTSIRWACSSNKQNSDSPYCADQDNYVWTTVVVGQHPMGLLQRGGLAVPKSANVRKGDIIAYHIAEGHPWGVFDRIAARAQDQTPTSSCHWDGSHFWGGGVVCDGWKWNKDYPLLAD